MTFLYLAVFHEVHPAGIRIRGHLRMSGYIHFVRRRNSKAGQVVHAADEGVATAIYRPRTINHQSLLMNQGIVPRMETQSSGPDII